MVGHEIRARLSILWIVICLAAAGCGGGGTTDDLVTQGQLEYRATCAMCHGRDAEGSRLMGKDLRRNEFVAARSDAELIEFLERGRSATHPDNDRGIEMPPKGGNPSLTEAELAAIVAYLRSIQ